MCCVSCANTACTRACTEQYWFVSFSIYRLQFLRVKMCVQNTQKCYCCVCRMSPKPLLMTAFESLCVLCARVCVVHQQNYRARIVRAWREMGMPHAIWDCRYEYSCICEYVCTMYGTFVVYEHFHVPECTFPYRLIISGNFIWGGLTAPHRLQEWFNFAYYYIHHYRNISDLVQCTVHRAVVCMPNALLHKIVFMCGVCCCVCGVYVYGHISHVLFSISIFVPKIHNKNTATTIIMKKKIQSSTRRIVQKIECYYYDAEY